MSKAAASTPRASPCRGSVRQCSRFGAQMWSRITSWRYSPSPTERKRSYSRGKTRNSDRAALGDTHSEKDSYHEQLLKDSEFLRNDKRLDSDLLDKLVLQLNRIYPQILSDKEAQKFRNLNVPTSLRLTQLLAHLQGKGEEACYELYRALHIHAEDVYFSLPTRISRRETADAKGTNTATDLTEKFVLNDRGPWFFLSCFSLAVGVALLYYYTESKDVGSDARKVLGFTALGLSCQASEVLLSYIESPSREQ